MGKNYPFLLGLIEMGKNYSRVRFVDDFLIKMGNFLPSNIIYIFLILLLYIIYIIYII